MRSLLALLLALPIAAHAQSTEDALKARLLHQPLYLRQTPGADKLHFDSAGALLGKVPQTSFTLSGIEIKSLKLKANELQLTGVRVGLEFVDKTPKRVALLISNSAGPGTSPEEMKVVIDPPQSGDYGAALDAIFTAKLVDLVPQMPIEWQSYARTQILPEVPAEKATKPVPDSARRVGGGVTAPKVLFAPEPQYNEPARALRKTGTTLIYLQVDKAGNPGHIRILRPIGVGLDELSVLVVRRYRFQPATENGQPVAVELNVELNYQIF